MRKHDVPDLITCSVYIHDYKKYFEKTKDKWIQLCLTRDQILAIKLEPLLSHALNAMPEALTTGIRTVWPQANIIDDFRPANALGDRWWVAHREGYENFVHYNVFTGSLLVDGKPLSTLPDEYVEQPLYKEIFGDRLLDVIASSDAKMEFMIPNLINSHEVHFGFRNGQLQIFAKKGANLYVALSRGMFVDDLPTCLLREVNPWLCVQSSMVEFRSKDDCWTNKPAWRLIPVPASPYYTMMSSTHYLLDNHRGLGQTICGILRNFEHTEYVHVRQNKITTEISVELPRYHLSFVLNGAGQLKCNELAAVISPIQAIGTLHGLQSRLVLQSEGSEMSNPKRWVLIPYGEVQVQHQNPHVRVEVDITDYDYVTYFQYSIDTTLEQLSATQVEAHLWKAYLHALTSSCLPDHFTHRTGVEESFVALKDSLIRTCVPFSVTSQQILERISHLAPIRSFYPASSRHMQTVIWNEELSFLTQIDMFFELVHDITAHNHQVQFLHQETEFVIPAYRGNDADLLLAERAKWAWEKLYRTGFISENAQPSGDRIYEGRDRDLTRDTEAVMGITSIISRWQPADWDGKDIYATLQGWKTVKGFNSIFSPTSLTDSLSVNLVDSWASLLTCCLRATKDDKHELLFIFSLMVFGKPELRESLTTLLSFAIVDDFKDIGLPIEAEYDLSCGSEIDWNIVKTIIDEVRVEKPGSKLSAGEQYDGVFDLDETFDFEAERQQSVIEEAVRKAWPSPEVELPTQEELTSFHIGDLLPLLNGRLAAWCKNHVLQQHCVRWEMQLVTIRSPAIKLLRQTTLVSAPNHKVEKRPSAFPSLLERMKETDVTDYASRKPQSTDFDLSISALFEAANSVNGLHAENSSLCRELEGLINSGTSPQDPIEDNYRKSLLASVAALDSHQQDVRGSDAIPSKDILLEKLEINKFRVLTLLNLFDELCQPRSTPEKGLRLAELWPRATTSALLQLLSRKYREEVPKDWQVLLVGFAREITARQRIQRMIRFLEADDRFALRRELENVAHEKWNLLDNLDWLLIEIQNDILIRPVQINLTRELIRPESAVLQLQMGDGKSSVILPLFCTSVADGNALVRVVVIRALSKEMLTSLSKALSGLVGRPVFWLPFSRSTKITKSTAGEFRNLWNQARKSGGVLLTLPEHLNSFRLIGNDQLAAGRTTIASSLLSAQKWLDSNTRDIIDESDAVLSPRYELVYTNGEDKPLSGTPYRWQVLFSVLDLVELSARAIHTMHPVGLEFKENAPGEFASVRILNEKGGAALIHAVLERLSTDGIPTLSLNRKGVDIEAAMAFIQQIRVNGQIHQLIKDQFETPEEVLAINLLRGLFAWGYLGSAFRKRWFVDYGLARSRCMMAVPYRSKGVPAPASEFAEPDMAVMLTAMAYYYTGLELEDMRTALAILLRLPYAAEVYAGWIDTSRVPKIYRKVSSVNVQDDVCVETLHDCLKKRKTTIDFFLKTVVLAKESKEYPFKLSSSAWDLCAGNNGKVTSGFSGTCDSMMPIFLPQKRLPDLLHFDAAVLLNLLQPRNRRYLCARTREGKALETVELLKFIDGKGLGVSVLIDVGAQTLDRNEDVAFMWLRLRPGKLAAVFFDESTDEKMVVTPDRDVVPWISSPFKEQIDKCLIYLDQHHTRGTDFSLPDDFAAAVLLGPSLQKDAFVQSAIRLRKLAYTQTVIMVAPPEVDNDIRALLSKESDDILDSTDIIRWTIHNSCEALRSQQALHTLRGLEFLKRYKAFERMVTVTGAVKNRAGYIDAIRTAEVNNVESLYPVGVNSLAKPPKFNRHEKADKLVQQFLTEWQRLDKAAYFESSKYDEQEREQMREQEFEQEREVQRPKAMNPKDKSINKSLEEIIVHNRRTQSLPDNVVPAFELMGSTSLFTDMLRRKWQPIQTGLVATQDFLKAVKSATDLDHDDYLRPVYFCLKLAAVRELILISPHEAQEWLPHLRKCTVATLLVYSAKTTKHMANFDKLDVYTIPETSTPVQVDPNIMTCLRIFAGHLYFSDIHEYVRFCVLLDLEYNPRLRPDDQGMSTESMLKLSRAKINGRKPDYKPMVKKWINMRRKGVEWAHTHVGRVLNGEKLRAKDFEL